MIIEPITAQAAEVAPVVPTKSGPDGPVKTPVAPDASSGAQQDVGFLQEVLEVAQDYFHISDVGLNFSIHGDTGRVKISVTDKNTGELIREIPPEQVLNLMAKIDEMMGILFDQKA